MQVIIHHKWRQGFQIGIPTLFFPLVITISKYFCECLLDSLLFPFDFVINIFLLTYAVKVYEVDVGRTIGKPSIQ